MNFDHIILEPEQKELFIRICEVLKSIPRDNRMDMIYEEYTVGGCLIIRSMNSGIAELEDVQISDMDEFSAKGLIRTRYSKKGTPNYNITPEGFQYYGWLMKQQGKPVERIEKSIKKYMELGSFKKTYVDTYRKLKEAEDMLWTAEKEEQFTTIGHLCREAVQDFAETLYKNVMGTDYEGQITETNNRIEILIAEKCDSKKVRKYLRALFDYWKAVGGLIQKQEHRGKKEYEPLTWEDARRLVFQTVNVMSEIDRTLGVKS